MKVLVTVASKHGATAEIGSVIGSLLETEQFEVDVLPPDEVKSVEGYDAIVLGSGVYAGHWLKPAKEFTERHESALREKPLFIFSSGPVGDAPNESDEPAEARALGTSLHPVDSRVFGGRLTGSQLGSFEKLIIKVVRAPMADDRPWEEIAAWAKQIARYLDAGESEAKKAEVQRLGAVVAATTSVVM